MKVVIVGGGFAGVRTALTLANRKDIDVKLISSQTYFEYHAALYRSATGRSPLEVAIPLRDFFSYARNVEVLQDTMADLNHNNKQVVGETGARYHYDSLILAPGNVTEFYGIRGLKKYAFGVKTIHEALKLKRHLHDQLVHDGPENNYAVIGAGATGVELSAELSAYLKKIRRKHKIKRKFTVHLIEAGPRVMPAMPEDFSKMIERRLKKLKVKLLLNTAVKSETSEGIQLPDGLLPSRTVVWTAGVANNPLFDKFPDVFRFGKAGRIEVDEYLQAAPDIFVLGDSAATPYTGMAQTALYDAILVADNLLRTMHGKARRTYRPKRPIYAVPVGPRWAAVLWGKARIYGRAGWLVRRVADFRLYLTFLPLKKALTAWRYGFVDEEVCPICKG